MCEECFQGSKIDHELLDDHSYAPFSPENLVPFHPYTQKWANKRALNMESEEEPAWSPNDEKQQSEEEEETEEPAAEAAAQNPEVPAVTVEASEVPAVTATTQANLPLQVNVPGEFTGQMCQANLPGVVVR